MIIYNDCNDCEGGLLCCKTCRHSIKHGQRESVEGVMVEQRFCRIHVMTVDKCDSCSDYVERKRKHV